MDTGLFLHGVERAVKEGVMINLITAFIKATGVKNLLRAVFIARSGLPWDQRPFQEELSDKRLVYANDK